MPESGPTISGLPFDAVLFDLDGVVTNTAAVHAASWEKLFTPILAERGLAPFDRVHDYPRYLDGQTREDGIQRFLASRGIPIERGSARDRPGQWTAFGLGKTKNEIFAARLAVDGVGVFPGTTDLLHRLRAGRVPVGVVTSSRNAHAVMAAAGVGDLFDTVVDGQIVEDRQLEGKPDPAMFLEAARRLGAAPAKTAVVEDAVAGVEAGKRGGFGFVVGVDRSGQRYALEAAGADIVVDDVQELDLGESRVHAWTLAYEGFDPAHEGHREALTALGNGYMVVRGAQPESRDDAVHYPATYLAGVYNRAAGVVHGRPVEEEQLVNVPNWLPLDIRIGDGGWWSEDAYSVTSEQRALDLRTGVLTRRVVLVDRDDRHLEIGQRRFVSMDNPHLAVLQTTLTARGFSGPVTVRAGIDASVRNANVQRDKEHGSRHLTSIRTAADADLLTCECETTASRIRIALAVRVTVDGTRPDDTRSEPGPRGVRHELVLDLADGDPVTVTKTAAVVTSRDPAISSPAGEAVAHLDRGALGFDALSANHIAAWRRLWERFAIDIDADKHCQLVLNLHVFHTLQSISPHTANLDAGVPARGLHGEGYRGHVFWDEVFVLPVIGARLPHVTRALLEYRWRRLPAAREIARSEGARGASFPWQSASDGTEQSSDSYYNPKSGRWVADNSSLQKHVSLIVAYDAWQYFETTDDRSWLGERGAELILEVARYFSAIARRRPGDSRAHIEGTMGPDEYHDGYPDAPGRGLRDNTYTNVLASWVCDRAADCLTVLDGHPAEALRDRLGIDDAEVARWRELATTFAVPFTPDGILDQFEGFHDLAELDWERYRARYTDLSRIDLILEAEGDSPLRYQLTKQPDVLMLLYLLGREGVLQQVRRLGYELSTGDLDRTVEYYLQRTVHGSTLSRVALSAILADVDSARAWSVYRAALVADLDDTQGGTTSEGIHLGAMAGTAGLTIRSFAGVRTDGSALRLDPHLPSRVRKLGFEVWYRGHRVDIAVDQTGVALSLHPASAPPILVRVGHQTAMLGGGDRHRFEADPPTD